MRGFIRSLGMLLLTISDLFAQPADSFKAKLKPFIDAHCIDCHGPDVSKAGLRLDNLKLDGSDARTIATWAKAHDRVLAGEMPPKKRQRPPQAEIDVAVSSLRSNLHTASLEKQQKEGRVVLRRLNGTEYENSLHDLLALSPNIQLKTLLPEDNVAAGFDNVSAALEISPAHLLAYQQAAERAIIAAVPPTQPNPSVVRLTGRQMTEKSPAFKEVLGKTIWLKGDALVMHTPLPDYIPCATPLVMATGKFKVSIFAYAIGTNGQPMTAAFLCRPIRERGAGEVRVTCSVPADKPAIIDAEFEMNRETNVRFGGWALPDRYAFSLKKVAPPIEKYDGPGLVVEWMQIEGPLGEFPPESYRRLFGDVPLKPRSVIKAEMEKRPIPKVALNRPESFAANYDPLLPGSAKPNEDADRLIRDFLPRALRRPVTEEMTTHYVKLVHERLDRKYSFFDAMLFGYKAILSSTHFLYFQEPGTAKLTDAKDFATTRLDDHALANRLSYFLWSSIPDCELLAAADSRELSKPEKLRAQVERMLKHPKAQRFTENFIGQWLDLRKINDTTPDPQLFNEFDTYLLWSMPRETESFFAEVLKHDRSLLDFVDSDWTMLNERLAKHYGIAGVLGHAFRKVTLPADSHRGGVITHASVLKVTADGTRTSPVLRGKWVLERILGKPPAPPPPDIPFFEPDIRGATTIREQLDKHRNTPACATCHVHIDPPGFALENFDAIGGWRDFYRATKQTKKGNVKGTRYFRGPDVEVGGVTADGKSFKNIDDYKKILLADRDQITRNLAQNLLIYATGAEVQFADREVVEQIVANVRKRDYGFRSLVHEVISSRVFLHK